MGDYDYSALPSAAAQGTPLAPPPTTGNLSSMGPEVEARIKQLEGERDFYGSQMGPQYKAWQQGSLGVKDLLDKAVERLQTTPAFAPSKAETWGNIARAASVPAPQGGFYQSLGNVGGAMSDQMKQAREMEIKRQELMTQYGIQAGQMGLQANQAMLAANRGEYDKRTQQIVQLTMGAQRANPTRPSTLGITKDEQGQYHFNPSGLGAAAAGAQAVASGVSAGGQHLVKLSDGTQILVHGLAPNIGTEVPDRPGITVTSSHPAPMANSRPSAAATPQQGSPPGTPAPDDPMLMGIFSHVSELPESIYNSPKTLPILQESARIAAQHVPMLLPPAAQPGHFGQNSGFVKQQAHNEALREKISTKYYADNDQAEAVQDKMRSMLDELDSGLIETGDINVLKIPLERALVGLGLIKDAEHIHQISLDQEFDKAALDVALHGLRDTFPGRVTNMEVDINRKANPNRLLTTEAIRALLQMNIERAQAVTLKTNAWGWYQAQHDSNAGEFKNWYNTYLNPRMSSMARSRAMFYLNHMGLYVDPTKPDPLTATHAAPAQPPAPTGPPQPNPKYKGFTDQQLQDRIRTLEAAQGGQ